MIEKIILDHLNDHLSQDVYMENPTPLPDSYVLIERTGGGKRNQLNTASVAIQSCSTSMYGAASLNEEVKACMDQLIFNDQIARVELETDYNFTNTATKQYRYQAVYNITYYTEVQ